MRQSSEEVLYRASLPAVVPRGFRFPRPRYVIPFGRMPTEIGRLAGSGQSLSNLADDPARISHSLRVISKVRSLALYHSSTPRKRMPSFFMTSTEAMFPG